MTKLEKRKTLILDVLRKKNKLSVKEAVELIDASAATVRRFFQRLSNEGLAVRVHGGIQLVPEARGTYSYILSNTSSIEQKTSIAGYAVELIESGDLVFLDSGTTILKLAEMLEHKFEDGSLSDIVVVTNSLVSYEKLCPNCTVILVGGEVRLSRRDTSGRIAENALSSLHFRKSFFGADAIHPEKGLMATDEWTMRMNEIVQQNSDSVFVLADSTKFGRSSLLTYSKLTEVDMIITDDGIPQEDLEQYTSSGAKIEVVNHSLLESSGI
ncbi:MAG: DeoR/GlpR family DNA-binding transcription regulator [Spirochaetia bacterium]